MQRRAILGVGALAVVALCVLSAEDRRRAVLENGMGDFPHAQSHCGVVFGGSGVERGEGEGWE